MSWTQVFWHEGYVLCNNSRYFADTQLLAHFSQKGILMWLWADNHGTSGAVWKNRPLKAFLPPFIEWYGVPSETNTQTGGCTMIINVNCYWTAVQQGGLKSPQLTTNINKWQTCWHPFSECLRPLSPTKHSTSEDTLSLWRESRASASPIITLKAL